MRLVYGEKPDDGGSGFSTETPVELGESGDAMMGAGRVRRLRYVGVRSGSGEGRVGELNGT